MSESDNVINHFIDPAILDLIYALAVEYDLSLYLNPDDRNNVTSHMSRYNSLGSIPVCKIYTVNQGCPGPEIFSGSLPSVVFGNYH